MRHVAPALALLIVFAACSSNNAPTTTAVPGQGAISVHVDPNPIRATRVSGDTYDFPFEVVVRETGGRAVTVNRVTATVTAFGGLTIHRESWDAERIRSMGYSTALGARGELRYRFAPRKEVPDDRLFSGVNAQLVVEATDDTDAATTASTTVTVTR